MSLESGDSTKASLTSFTIPRSSFTAFRLLYAPAHEVGELSKVIYLGAIPKAWYGGKQYGLVANTVKRAKKKIRLKLKGSYTIIDRSIKLSVTQNLYWTNKQHEWSEENPDDAFSGDLLDPCLNEELQEIEFPNEPAQDDDLEMPGGLSPVASAVSEEGPTVDFDDHNELLFNQAFNDTGSEGLFVSEYDGPRLFLPRHSFVDEERDAENNDHLEGSTVHASGENLKPILVNSKTQHLQPHRVTFDPSARSSRGSSMAFASPVPETEAKHQELENEYIKAKKKHLKNLKKVGGLAKKGGHKARSKGSRVKLKVARRIMSKFKPGQILRVDRMLVQLLKCEDNYLETHYNEELFGKLRITDRWREYNVVLRKADDLLALLVLQFYDPKKGNNFDEKPLHKMKLLPGAKIGFYSNNDKTISVTVPKEWGVRIAIMNTKYESVAYRWLFVVNGILEEEEPCIFNVTLPGLGQGIRIPMTPSVLSDLKQTQHSIEVSSLDFGYHISPGVLPMYLRDKIYRKLNHAARFDESVKNWLAENPDPWFCFKFYDRLEWAPPNSMIFYVMHKLMHQTYELQLRQVSRPLISVNDKKGVTWIRPYPLEGYLGRATNTAGKDLTNMTPYYKLGYFFTVDHMFFFTKLFEGRPPSPNNESDSLQVDDEDFRQLPSFFVKDPFEVDKHGHIPWLNQPNFEARDKHIVDELERRIGQITKAGGVVDLLQVKSIDPYPYNQLYKKQLYFHAFFWHGVSEDLEGESFLDCVFQIELMNGTKFRLMAHNQTIRDEWVARLRDIVSFHRMLEARRIAKATEIRKSNMKKLQFSEYVDSNFVNEYHGFENAFAAANEQTFDLNGLAMSQCILMSGYLFMKHKKHANFGSLYVVLVPGYLILFSLARRSKATGMLKRRPCYEHYFTIPVSECFVYLGNLTAFDLIEYDSGNQEKVSGHNQLPRIYPDGWKLCEEESQLCFTLWFGQKRKLRHQLEVASNPGLIKMVRLLGLTGKNMVFMARSRQLIEAWVNRLLLEINRFSGAL